VLVIRVPIGERAGERFETLHMTRTSPTEFIHQVRQELSRVTWPTRKETLVTTGMVFLMVFIAAAFFFAVDQVLSFGVRLIYGLGH
jgi:preprotein translocase subunit SecE